MQVLSNIQNNIVCVCVCVSPNLYSVHLRLCVE